MANEVYNSHKITSNANESSLKCNFPAIPKQSTAVQSLLEVSDSMDAAILQSKASSSKATNYFGPWSQDEKWTPRKQRTNRNYRKQVTRLLLSKRSSTSVELLGSSSIYADDKYENHSHVEIGSSRDAMDPYFKRRPLVMPAQPLKNTNLRTNTPMAGAVLACHQTPSLPTLITLQSPANRNFHSAFSLGKVEYNDSEITSSDGVPLLLYTKSGGVSRQKKQAAFQAPVTVTSGKSDHLSVKSSDNRTQTSCDRRASNIEASEMMKSNSIKQIDGEQRNEIHSGNTTKMLDNSNRNNTHNDNEATSNEETENLPNNHTETKSGTTNGLTIPLPNKNINTNTTNNNNIIRNGSIYLDQFETLTSPPENPKILKILSQRKPSPPMCEFEDISVHIRHYRMYHTVRFTGRFSLANQQIVQEDVKPVQWSEVFPHRPLSVNASTTVPVFRLNVQDFSSNDQTTDNTQDNRLITENDDNDKRSQSFDTSTGEGASKLQVPKMEEEKESVIDLEEEYKSYRRRSTPNYKDRSVTIDLTPTVTPVLKYKVKKQKDECDDNGDCLQEEKKSKTDSGNKRRDIAEKENSVIDSFEKYTKRGIKKRPGQTKNDKRSTKEQSNLSEDVKIIGNINMKTEEVSQDNCVDEAIQKSPSGDLQSSRNDGEGERTAGKVLFSYREFLKRSASNLSKDGIYTPRLRQCREPVSEADRQSKSRGDDWRYPFSRKHAFISIMHSDKDGPVQQWRNITIDEQQLKASVEEKIKDSRLHFKSRHKASKDVGDKFVKFMVKHDGEQESLEAKPSDEEKFRELRQFRKNRNTSGEETDSTNGWGIVSTYDVNACVSDTDEANDVSKDKSPRNTETSDDSTTTKNKKFWCPKTSCLSARTRKISENTETMRQLISTPFHTQALPQLNSNSAFVIALPPQRKCFDDRSVVLPLQDFVHLAMKGNDQTFSKVSQSINDRKLGISQNMTIRSATSRRSLDDGLVRLVSFASPVNQFIFAKRITGHSAASRGDFQLDGSLLDTEQKARSVFQGKGSSSFRLRLKDFGLHRQRTDHSQDTVDELPNHNEEKEEKHRKSNHTHCTDGYIDQDDDINLLDVDKTMHFKETKFIDIHIPNEGNVESDEVDNSKLTSSAPVSAKVDERRNQVTPATYGVNYETHTDADKPLGSKERDRSALRKRIVKLAEIRTSSQASEHDVVNPSGIYEGRASLSASLDIAQKTGKRGFKLIHGRSRGGSKLAVTTGSLDDFNDSLSILSTSHSFYNTDRDAYNESDNLFKFTNESIPIEIQDKLSEQQPLFNMRQKKKSKKRKKILNKPNAIIYKDIEAEKSSSMNSITHPDPSTKTKSPTLTETRTDTKGSIVPEGNPMMYSRIVRGSCLKKDAVADEVELQRPKTVRFKCDGVEYKIVERINDRH